MGIFPGSMDEVGCAAPGAEVAQPAKIIIPIASKLNKTKLRWFSYRVMCPSLFIRTWVKPICNECYKGEGICKTFSERTADLINTVATVTLVWLASIIAPYLEHRAAPNQYLASSAEVQEVQANS